MELFLESFPKIFISGIVMTLPLALVSFIIAMLIAIVCAMVQYAKVPVMKYVVQFYIWIFRGTPMLVQLFIMYFGMQSIGVRISAITAAIIVKDTSLATNITVTEMFMQTERIAGRTYQFMQLYIEVALVYLIFCTVLTWLQAWGEKKLNYYQAGR